MPLRDNRRIDSYLITDSPRPSLEDAKAHVLKRATLLLPDDRLLIELALKNHLSHRQISRLVKQPAGTVTRRLRRIENRLLSPLVAALTEWSTPLADDVRQLAIEHFLQGRSARELAEVHGMKQPAVRRVLAFVRGWHQGLQRWRT